MKSKNILHSIISILGVIVLFPCCQNVEPDNGSITYKGRIVTLTGNQPMPNITVRITNGTIVRALTVTQTDGLFNLCVFFSELDSNFYLELINSSGNSKKEQLRVLGGANEYDYGDIPFGNVFPTVETIGITKISENSFTCHCNVISQGNAPVTERGICWATNVPTISDHKKVCGSGEGEFFCTVENADINIITTTYYVRAYAINNYDIGYGEAIEINSSKLAYFSLPSFSYGGYTYHIHPDLGGMQWEQGNSACENLIAYGFDDWYLPNKEELLAVAEMTDELKKGYEYWTSSIPDNPYQQNRYYVDWNYNWGKWWGSNYQTQSAICRVVPIRKDR